jgi:hypothetical protein
MKKHLIAITLIVLVLVAGVIFYFAQGDKAQLAAGADTGKEPVFTAPRSELIPTMNVADVKGWAAGEKPMAAKGLSVAGFPIPDRCWRCPMATYWWPRRTAHPGRAAGSSTGS